MLDGANKAFGRALMRMGAWLIRLGSRWVPPADYPPGMWHSPKEGP